MHRFSRNVLGSGCVGLEFGTDPVLDLVPILVFHFFYIFSVFRHLRVGKMEKVTYIHVRIGVSPKI